MQKLQDSLFKREEKKKKWGKKAVPYRVQGQGQVSF